MLAKKNVAGIRTGYVKHFEPGGTKKSDGTRNPLGQPPDSSPARMKVGLQRWGLAEKEVIRGGGNLVGFLRKG